MFSRFLLCVGCIVFASGSIVAAEPHRTLVVGHRGLLRHAPENTLAGFRACLELRLGFEFDVQRTKDGQLVCIHDDSVDRTTGSKGKVSALTLDEIGRLDAGSWFDRRFASQKVPTIEDVVKLIAEYRQHEILAAVDLKAFGVEEGVVQLAARNKILDRLLFIGNTISQPEVRERIKRASMDAQTAVLTTSTEDFPTALAAANADWIYFRYLPSKEQIEAIHRQKKRAFIAGTTVSDNVPENWKAAFTVGMDGILTDYPLELGAMLRDGRSQ
jgi:glycerophosphoryl diester phosphodiesterase